MKRLLMIATWTFFVAVVMYKTGRGDAYDARAQVHEAQNAARALDELLQQCRTK